MKINTSQIYNWTYGFYFDSTTKLKLDSQAILSQKQLSNNKRTYNLFNLDNNNINTLSSPQSSNFSLPPANNIFKNNDYLKSARQSIRIPLNYPTNITSLRFNSDIFENLSFVSDQNITIPFTKAVLYMLPSFVSGKPTSPSGSLYTFYDTKCLQTNNWTFGSRSSGGSSVLSGEYSGAIRTGEDPWYILAGRLTNPELPVGIDLGFRFGGNGGTSPVTYPGWTGPQPNNIPFMVGEPIRVSRIDSQTGNWVHEGPFYIQALGSRLGGQPLMRRLGDNGSSPTNFIPNYNTDVDIFLSCSPYSAYQPRVIVKTLSEEIIIPIELFYYDEKTDTIFFNIEGYNNESKIISSRINNVTEIILEGSQPFKQKLFGSTLLPTGSKSINYFLRTRNEWGSEGEVDSLVFSETFYTNKNNLFLNSKPAEYLVPDETLPGRYKSSIITELPLVSTNTNGTIKPLLSKGYGSLYNYLEFITDKSLLTDLDLFKVNTINNQLYLTLANSPAEININNNPRDYILFRNISFGNQQIGRLAFIYSKPLSNYAIKPTDSWLNELLYLAYSRDKTKLYNASFFEIDDTEFIDIYIAESVHLKSLQISTDSVPVSATPTPTQTSTPTNTLTPTNSRTPSSTPPFRIRGKGRIWGTSKSNDFISQSLSTLIKEPVLVDQDETYVGSLLHFDRLFLGSRHALFSREDKAIFPVFDNSIYQLGITTNDSYLDKLNTILMGINKWKMISIGDDFSYAIDSDNFLYRWGLNQKGSLASPLDKLQSPSRIILDNGASSFIDVSCANNHAFIIDSNNNIYYTGYIYSSLVINEFASYSFNQHKWVKVISNNKYTLGIKKDDNKLYLLREPRIASFFKEPIVIDEDISNYKQIVAGSEHFLLIKSDNTLWGFGNNQYNQLSSNIEQQEVSDKFVLIDNSRVWTKIAAGNKHSLVLDDYNTLYGWGDNSLGQLGVLDIDGFSHPTAIWGGNWIDIDANFDWSGGIVDELGQIWITQTPTPTPTSTLTNTPTSTSTLTPTATPIASQSVTPTSTPTPTTTMTPSITVSPTPTDTPTPTPTQPYDFILASFVP